LRTTWRWRRVPRARTWGAEVLTTAMPWHPVVDGDVIPASPIERIVAGAGAEVDVLVGANTDNWRLFVVASGEIGQVTDQALARFAALLGLLETALAAYRGARPGASAGDR
jgi:para-nitrobenzyl esterase